MKNTKGIPRLKDINPAINGPITHATFEKVYIIPSFSERDLFLELSFTIIPKLIIFNVERIVIVTEKRTKIQKLCVNARIRYEIEKSMTTIEKSFALFDFSTSGTRAKKHKNEIIDKNPEKNPTMESL